jgi:dTDP-glucose 4,6-dehydratase
MNQVHSLEINRGVAFNTSMPKMGLKLRQNFNFFNDFLRGKRVLITGGTGYFGKVLTETLSVLNEQENLGMALHVLARTTKNIEPQIHFHRHDISNPFESNKSLPPQLDILIHAASPLNIIEPGQESAARPVMVEGTKNAWAYAKQTDCSHFLFASSGAVYGAQTSSASYPKEESPCLASRANISQLYGALKVEAEAWLLSQASQSVTPHLSIARCFAFSGRHLPLNAHFAISSLMSNAIAKKDLIIKSNGLAVRSYMDSEDLAFWLIALIARSEHKSIFNVGSDQEFTILEVAKKILKLSPDSKIIVDQPATNHQKGPYYVPDTSKAQSLLNVKCLTSLDESLEKLYQQHIQPKEL